MKVIHDPKASSGNNNIVNCRCRCVFEFSEQDRQSYIGPTAPMPHPDEFAHYSSYEAARRVFERNRYKKTRYYYVVCPSCGKHNAAGTSPENY